MKCAAVLLAFTLSIVPAQAQSDRFAGAYLCLQEFGGGIRWNEATKSWGSTTFNASGKFVLKLSANANRTVTNTAGEEVHVTDYDVTITPMGRDFPSPCSPRGRFVGTVTVGSAGWLSCEASLTDYSFNLVNLRFLEAYMVGYTGGQDNNDNTPAMMGGTCAKID